jgi:GAF domain-containing protein
VHEVAQRRLQRRGGWYQRDLLLDGSDDRAKLGHCSIRVRRHGSHTIRVARSFDDALIGSVLDGFLDRSRFEFSRCFGRYFHMVELFPEPHPGTVELSRTPDALVRRCLDRVAAAAATLLDVPLVLISVLDGPRQVYVGSHGLARSHVNEPSPLCREVASAGKPIVMQDARTRLPAAARGVWGFELVSYAGVTLNLLDRSHAGTLAALAPSRRAWQDHDLQILHCLADTAAAILDLDAEIRREHVPGLTPPTSFEKPAIRG